MTEHRDQIYSGYVAHFKGGVMAFDQQAATRMERVYGYYLRRWLPAESNAPIADLGCGSGYFLHFLKSRGYTQTVGVDISPQQVAIANTIAPQVCCEDLFAFLKRNDKQYTTIVALDVIEHLTKAEALHFLAACFAALRQGGRLILQTPNAASPWFGAVRYGDFTHELCLEPRLLRQLLMMQGFTEVKCREAGPVPRGTKSKLRYGAWRILRQFLLAWNRVETGSVGEGIMTRVFFASALKP